MNSSSFKRLMTLLSVRIILIVLFQLLLVVFLSWDEARPWWPFAMIATEIVCLFILIFELKRENASFSSLQLKPFESTLPLGRLSQLLAPKPAESRLRKILTNLFLFCVLLLFLGFPAIVLNGFLNENIPILRDTATIGALPQWALYLMLGLLPVFQALVEFPWFYGFIYPRLEAYFEGDKGERRLRASVMALSIVLVFFILQIALIPLILDPVFIFWRAVSFLPLFLVIGITVRLAPRFMPGLNLLHALMAINVVIGYWNV
jgi:hypothetical protein